MTCLPSCTTGGHDARCIFAERPVVLSADVDPLARRHRLTVADLTAYAALYPCTCHTIAAFVAIDAIGDALAVGAARSA